MKDFIIILIIILIVGTAAFYIYKKKKSGSKCIGCPYSDSCCKCSAKSNHINKK
ncbi:FeoB-associated Cys-rich membrane protein [Eubacterium sp.]|uniref:FeoB-associated Cys-rich membrane protein n=1 Tax=Eubacterium sp. TaxID=142586 RepID=UPI003F065154